jgi:hypothetical protein
MAHFAELNSSNEVIQVVVISNEDVMLMVETIHLKQKLLYLI